MQKTSFDDLAVSFTAGCSEVLSKLLPPAIQHEVGHFNVFNLANIAPAADTNVSEPYSCRTFYKISFLTGSSDFSFPGSTVKIRQPTLLFTTPKVDTYWLPYGQQTGHFCVFTPEFLHPTRSGVILDELPLYKSPMYPAFMLSDADAAHTLRIFEQMEAEIVSGYAYKYDLLRAYALELVHLGQKLQPTAIQHPNHSAFARTTSMFIELLERQFPLQSKRQKVALRTAKEYADHLTVHVNHLNKVLKETTGLTTTELIAGRLLQEAKALLLQTDWTIAEIADCLGFSDFAHFAKFFKSQTDVPPAQFRVQAKSLNLT
jgi:AraC family transcriptional regulator, transcriptional activator of pobA